MMVPFYVTNEFLYIFLKMGITCVNVETARWYLYQTSNKNCLFQGGRWEEPGIGSELVTLV